MLENEDYKLLQSGGVRKAVLERSFLVVQDTRTVSEVSEVSDSAVEKPSLASYSLCLECFDGREEIRRKSAIPKAERAREVVPSRRE